MPDPITVTTALSSNPVDFSEKDRTGSDSEQQGGGTHVPHTSPYTEDVHDSRLHLGLGVKLHSTEHDTARDGIIGEPEGFKGSSTWGSLGRSSQTATTEETLSRLEGRDTLYSKAKRVFGSCLGSLWSSTDTKPDTDEKTSVYSSTAPSTLVSPTQSSIATQPRQEEMMTMAQALTLPDTAKTVSGTDSTKRFGRVYTGPESPSLSLGPGLQ